MVEAHGTDGFTTKTTFQDVKVGDRIYHHDYFAPDKWREVTDKRTSKSGVVSLLIGVKVYKTFDTRTEITGFYYESITVKR